jgi:quinol monooxygenase YgiN
MDSSPSLDVVTCSIEMRFAPDVLEEAVRMLVSAVGRTEARRGCRECVVARDAVEEGRVRYGEAWDSRGAFLRHLAGEEFQLVLVAMDMSLEEPRVTVGDLTGRRGIAHLQELREAVAGESS